MKELLIATNNRGKMAEFRRLLNVLRIDLRELSDFGIEETVEETADTFAENAELKAVAYAKLAGIPTLADDSGLVIDYLNGAPGVHSARYAGKTSSDLDRIKKVLSELLDAKLEERTARFICITAFADGRGNLVRSTEGICDGSIVSMPRGENGFGYDPIFLPNGFDLTFGEMPADVKQTISHRGRAVAKIIPFLQGFFENLT